MRPRRPRPRAVRPALARGGHVRSRGARPRAARRADARLLGGEPVREPGLPALSGGGRHGRRLGRRHLERLPPGEEDRGPRGDVRGELRAAQLLLAPRDVHRRAVVRGDPERAHPASSGSRTVRAGASRSARMCWARTAGRARRSGDHRGHLGRRQLRPGDPLVRVEDDDALRWLLRVGCRQLYDRIQVRRPRNVLVDSYGWGWNRWSNHTMCRGLRRCRRRVAVAPRTGSRGGDSGGSASSLARAGVSGPRSRTSREPRRQRRTRGTSSPANGTRTASARMPLRQLREATKAHGFVAMLWRTTLTPSVPSRMMRLRDAPPRPRAGPSRRRLRTGRTARRHRAEPGRARRGTWIRARSAGRWRRVARDPARRGRGPGRCRGDGQGARGVEGRDVHVLREAQSCLPTMEPRFCRVSVH